jgi:pimeloyl-ACP methyl ester carboxylesterase
VLVDQRGTGRSNPLLCAELQTGPTTPMLPLPAVNACRRKLSQSADLRFYGTRDAVSDLEDVRQALGYGKIDLFGLSYGTTVALRYMHRYPNNVRAAVLMGTAPPELRPPQHHATSAARALELVLADCESDTGCSAAYPRLRTDLAAARARLAAAGGRARDELFMERLRALLYSPASRARLPLMVTRAAAGDVRELFAKPTENGAAMIADGMYLAVTCGESFPTMDYAAAAAAARATPFGDYRLRRQKAACADWPRVALDTEFLALPQQSSAAVLLISGLMDPVTPPEWAEQVRSKLKRARHVVLPDGGHVPDGLDGFESCVDPLIISFLDHGVPERLETSCVERVSGPAYALK